MMITAKSPLIIKKVILGIIRCYDHQFTLNLDFTIAFIISIKFAIASINIIVNIIIGIS